MLTNRPLAVAALAPWIVAVGCTLSPPAPDEHLGSAEEALGYPNVGAKGSAGSGLIQTHGIISQNSLTPGLLVDPTYLAGLRPLGFGALTRARLDAAPAPHDANWFMLMRYTVHCALKWGDTVTVSDATGADLILYGNLGLAPDWVRGALDTPSQGWLTACLLAHSNNFGERVDILLTGEHPALQAPIMRGDMPLQEAAFYGNLFPLPGGAKPFLFACTGWDAQSCDATIISADLKRRVCGRSTQCGFDAVGPCWTAGTTTPDACDRAPGDLEDFTACHPYPGSPPTGDAYAQVITVDLKAVDMRSAHPTCASKLPPPADGCSHGLCDQGAVLSPTCDACTAAICAVDPYCCNVAWDGWCVGEVSSTCNCLEGLPRTCDTCAADVAALPGQAYCARAWDALCIRDLPTVGCAACP